MSSTPDEIWNELFKQDHMGTTKASWELPSDENDDEELDSTGIDDYFEDDVVGGTDIQQ